ncbi:MAG: hypothetical protein IPL93_01210 [Actinomycetales bacterium]|nr:hypothetical protein [Actinomycetales bacterium]
MTNIPANDRPDTTTGTTGTTGTTETIAAVEAWFRRRADIEGRIREAKLGAGLRHLPSGHHPVNAVWMWAALLAGNLSVLLQAPHRDRQARPRARRPTAPRTALRPRPAWFATSGA